MKIKAARVLSLGMIPIRFFIVISLFMSIPSRVMYPQSDSLIIEHYSLEQGLSNSTIWSIIQDRESYLWFATGKGVIRYDGYQFQSYINKPDDSTSFSNAVAWCSYVDKEGTLWFGSGNGLEKFNRRTNNFTNYLPDNFAKGHVIGNIVITTGEDKRGIFWVTTGKGIFKFNKISGKFSPVQYDYDSTNGTYTHYNFPFVAKDGSLWFASGQGLDKFNYESGKIIHYWRDPKNREINNDSFSKYFIHFICEDSNGTLWLGTNKGIVEFNKKLNTFTNYLPDASLHNFNNVNRVVALCFDPSGLLWVGTGEGIFTFDTKSKKFTQKFIRRSHHGFYYLGNNFITSLYIDRSGALWVGTLSDGIYKVILKKLPYKRYFSGGVHQVVKGKDGILWIVKDLKGKIKFDTRTEQIIPTNFGTNLSIYPDQSGNMYLKNNNSNYLTEVKDGKIIRHNLLKKAQPIYFEKAIGIWYGAQTGGLYFLDFNTDKASKIFNTETQLNAICKDSKGLVWAATVMGKLICYNTKNKSVSEYISNPQNPSSISGRTFFDIYEDKTGNVWFATDVGLNKFIPSTKTFIHFTEKDGLSGNTIYDILEDDHGNLWLGTNKGITKFIPQTNQFKNFDVLHGRSYSKWWNRLAVKMDDGEMFFGRSYGLIRFHPDSIKENTYIPPIVITSIRLFDKPLPFEKEINLTYDKNFLSFEFAALSYYNSERNQYAYKMEGVDKNWVYSGTRRYASYPNMEPGKYIFKVKGSNNEGIWNEAGTSISIIISPPWWNTWWFRFTSILILFVTAGGAIRYVELKKIKRKIVLLEQEGALERERTRISRDMHDEIGSNLSEIAILSELAKKNPGKAEHHIQGISELTSEVIDNVSEIVWAMNPQNDELDNLIAHTRRYAVKYLGLANINCRFVSPDDLPSYTLSAEFRRNIFLIVKEVLHNIVKHSCAPEVLFAVNFSDHNLEMKIEDNGKGFSLEKSRTSGNGLSNMKKRIEDIGGFITIQSACGKGTQISFSAKITL
jgi:ligand-binding sensor domain-containing protein